jgi:putative FmdB family regulatory protein
MPTYEYQCPKGHTFELFQKMTDKPTAKCPTCGRRATRAISGGAGLIFKGSGFYITDYGKDGKGPRKSPESSTETPAAKTDSGSDSKPADSGEKTTESKPEKKSKKGSK